MTAKKIELSYFDMVYHQVMALYATLQDTGQFTVKRAEIKQGECQALPIDFCADVELKAARTVLFNGYAKEEWNKVLSKPENYRFLPVTIRESMGHNFEASHLGVDGDYRTLYFRTKSQGKP